MLPTKSQNKQHTKAQINWSCQL